MKCSLGNFNILEEISSLSHSIVFLYFFALITEVESSDKTWSTGEGNGNPLQHSCLENPMTFHFQALEKEVATHSSVLAWRIPGMGDLRSAAREAAEMRSPRTATKGGPPSLQLEKSPQQRSPSTAKAK